MMNNKNFILFGINSVHWELNEEILSTSKIAGNFGIMMLSLWRIGLQLIRQRNQDMLEEHPRSRTLIALNKIITNSKQIWHLQTYYSYQYNEIVSSSDTIWKSTYSFLYNPGNFLQIHKLQEPIKDRKLD